MFAQLGVIILASQLPAATATAQDVLLTTLLAREKQVVEAIKEHNKQRLAELLAEQAYAVTPFGGRQTSDQLIQSLDGFDYTNFRIREARVVRATEDVAILSYRFSWTESREGEAATSTHVYATSTWALRDGRWMSVFYQSTPIPASDAQ